MTEPVDPGPHVPRLIPSPDELRRIHINQPPNSQTVADLLDLITGRCLDLALWAAETLPKSVELAEALRPGGPLDELRALLKAAVARHHPDQTGRLGYPPAFAGGTPPNRYVLGLAQQLAADIDTSVDAAVVVDPPRQGEDVVEMLRGMLLAYENAHGAEPTIVSTDNAEVVDAALRLGLRVMNPTTLEVTIPAMKQSKPWVPKLRDPTEPLDSRIDPLALAREDGTIV